MKYSSEPTCTPFFLDTAAKVLQKLSLSNNKTVLSHPLIISKCIETLCDNYSYCIFRGGNDILGKPHCQLAPLFRRLAVNLKGRLMAEKVAAHDEDSV